MATRLYPKTKNPKSLERMARVDDGTHDRWLVCKTLFGDRCYDFFSEDPQMDQMNSFVNSGWGRIKAFVFLALGLDPIAGSLDKTEKDKIMVILAMHHIYNVTPEECEGLEWS